MDVVAAEGVGPVSARADKHGRMQSDAAKTKTRRQEDFIGPHPSSEPSDDLRFCIQRIVRTSDVAYLGTRLGQENRSSIVPSSIVPIL